MSCFHTKPDKDGPWWSAKFYDVLTVNRIDILNRGDCCGNRLTGAKVFVGETAVATIMDAPKGEWVSIDTQNTEGSYVRIVGTPNTALHFCGIKIYGFEVEEEIIPEPIPEPEPPAPVKTPEKVVPPKPVPIPKCDKASMSSWYGNQRNNPCNPIKNPPNWNPNWG
jgi:hypothetical protein